MKADFDIERKKLEDKASAEQKEAQENKGWY